MWTYRVVQGFVSIEDRQYTTYGVSCGNIIIPDISTQKNLVSELVHKLNQLQLLPIHLHDVIDDFLVDCQYDRPHKTPSKAAKIKSVKAESKCSNTAAILDG